MKKFWRSVMVVALVVLAATLTGCGHPTEVPPAHVGKISTDSGLQEGIIPPSKLRLEGGFCRLCDTLVLAEASDFGFEESIKLFMPKDQLNLDVDVRGTLSVSPDEQNVEMIFARITAQDTADERVKLIPMKPVFETYGQPVIREIARTILSKYSIEQVMEERERISQELFAAVRKALQDSPITVINFGLADIQPPQVIVTAQETRKEREIAIERAEAEKQVALKEAEADLEVAIKQQEVDLKEAETQVLVNTKMSEGVNPAFIAQRALRVLEEMAKSPNKVFFVPTEAMSNPALMLGMVSNGFQPVAPTQVSPAVTAANAPTVDLNQLVAEPAANPAGGN